MTRRFDPDRRNRIIDAAIDCIAEVGVAGTSHRKVAALADVPLGSMTYHFDSMDELLVEAFTRFATTIAEAFEQRLRTASDAHAALEAIVDLIHVDLQRSNREQVVTYELYTLAARQARFRSITNKWMRASRTALSRHFPTDTVQMLDAYIEGAALHIALDTEPQDRTHTRAALHRLTAVPVG
jgi:DNA-binding transcriptional regulator YbjK